MLLCACFLLVSLQRTYHTTSIYLFVDFSFFGPFYFYFGCFFKFSARFLHVAFFFAINLSPLPRHSHSSISTKSNKKSTLHVMATLNDSEGHYNKNVEGRNQSDYSMARMRGNNQDDSNNGDVNNEKTKPASSSFLDRDFLSFGNNEGNGAEDLGRNSEGESGDNYKNNDNDNQSGYNGGSSSAADAIAAASSWGKKRGRSSSPQPDLPPPPTTNSMTGNRNTIKSIPWLAPMPPKLPPHQQQQRHSRDYNNNNNRAYKINDNYDQQQHQTHQQYYNLYSPPLIRLHNEIASFVSLMSPTPHELALRDAMVDRITKLSHSLFGGNDKCQVLPFGSQVTGLCLPGSDIDFVIRFHPRGVSGGKVKKGEEEGDDDDDDDNLTQNPLHQFAEAVQNEFGLRSDDNDNRIGQDNGGDDDADDDDNTAAATAKEYLSYLEIIESARVPLVKFTIMPYNLDIDVCFDQPHGPESADLMHRFMESMPPLRSLTFVLKYFLASREINKPFTGGIGSYLLQLMIVSYLQHRAREDVARNCGASGKHYNLGSLLLEFFELYGVDYNYVTTGISVRHDGYYFAKGGQDVRNVFWQPSRPFSIAMENPLDPTSDVGAGAFKMQMIQRIFGHAFKTLLAYVSEPYERTDSILARIIPPTEEMEKRMVLKRGILLDDIGDDDDGDGTLTPSTSNGRSNSKKKRKNEKQKVERNGEH